VRKNIKAKHISGNSYHNKLFLQDYKDALWEFTEVVNGLIKSTTEDCAEWEKMAWHAVELLNLERGGEGGITLLRNVKFRDSDTFTHSVNVAMLSYDIAKWAGKDKVYREEAALCGLLHDVGKLMVPEEILKKPGKLSEKEIKLMRRHPLQGYYSLLFFHDENVRLAALQHHERYDGKGYPYGIQGDEINEFAKIVAIADVYDALTADRVYRKAMVPEKALAVMDREKNSFAPEYYSVFVSKVKELLMEKTKDKL